jgi:hypothetical protein
MDTGIPHNNWGKSSHFLFCNFSRFYFAYEIFLLHTVTEEKNVYFCAQEKVCHSMSPYFTKKSYENFSHISRSEYTAIGVKIKNKNRKLKKNVFLSY